MRRLEIDPTRVELGWVIDFCAQALRNITIGMGHDLDLGIVLVNQCTGFFVIAGKLRFYHPAKHSR